MAGNVLEFSETTFSTQVLENSRPVLVDFWAPWCGPCKMLGPTIEEIANDYAGKCSVGKVNTDQDGSIASQYGIQGIPTVILFKGGQPVDRLVGLVSKTKLSEMIEKAL